MLLNIFLLILAIPIGLLLAHTTREELVSGRKWFKTIIVLSVLVGIFSAFKQNYVLTWTCAFILMVTLVSYMKSFSKNFTKRRV